MARRVAWTDDEDKTLKRLRAEGLDTQEIAGRMKRSFDSVNSRIQRKRMPLSRKPATNEPTTTERLAEAQRENKKHLAALDEAYAQLARERSRRTIKFGRPKSGKSRRGFCRVTWGDTHGMRVDKAAFAAFVADVKLIGPSEVICMGDALDCDGHLSRHRPVGYRALSPYSYADDVDAANAQWDAVCKAAPKARHDYLAGNHEDRIMGWIRDQNFSERDERFHRERLSPQAVLSLKKRGVTYHERILQHDGLQKRGTIKRGKCLFVHGDSHAKRAAEVHLMGVATNIVFAHTHRTEQFVTSTETTGVISAWNPGCLCERHQMYQHSAPSKWSQGYGLQFISAAGDFLHINVPIIEGKSYLQPMVKLIGA